MRISAANSYSSVYNMYNSMFQASSSLNNLKMNRGLIPSNKAKDSKKLGEGALDYVKNIKSASKNLSASLKNLSGAAFTKKPEAPPEVKSKTPDYAKSAVESLVKNYNDLYVEAAQKTNDPKAQKLASKMIDISKTYKSSLSNIGIGFDNDGKMTLDTKKLDAALENGSLEKFFKENSGKNYGFTNQLSRLADNVSRNTSNYVSSSVIRNDLMENFAYSGFKELIQYNYLSTGLMYDYKF